MPPGSHPETRLELDTMRIRTHAKLNLFLRVLGSRKDGYHDLETILHGVKLFDEIDITTTDDAGVDLQVTCAPGVRGQLSSGEDNLIHRAAEHLVRAGAGKGAAIRLLKRIPIGAGLGGGSANAAGTLVALNELWGHPLNVSELLAAATALGSDVPYCLTGGTALATARGEQVTPLAGPDSLWFVLGISHRPLLTRDVYRRWDGLEASNAGSAALMRALDAGDVAAIAALLHNDLEPAALLLRPELEEGRAALERAGALGTCLSGSGPTWYGLCSDEGHARRTADALGDRFDRVEVVRSSRTCVEHID